MKKNVPFNKIALYSLAAVTMLASSQAVFAHTRLQAPVILEGTRVYNNEVIGHGCKSAATGTTSIPVIGTSVVFPDSTATVTSIPVGAATGTAATPAGAVTDWITGAGEGYSKKVYSADIFTTEYQKTDSLGNAVGYATAGGNALPGIGYTALIPFKTDAVGIQPASCANSVTFVVAIADVCKVTNIAGFTGETANLWTPAVGSNFDGPGLDGYNSPATLKVVRNTTGTPATLTAAAVAANPLPANCGKGLDITITPTAAQINRDLPVIFQGQQVWPAK